jgi:hypothetical protein
MNNAINIIEITGVKNETLNFENILIKSISIIIKNCYNVKIIIKSKINKIIVEKSNKILVNIYKLINGFEISNSDYVLISNNNKEIPLIDIFKSSVYLIGNIKLYSDIKIICSMSNLFYVNID